MQADSAVRLLCRVWTPVALLVLAVPLLPGFARSPEAEELESSCVDCHGNPGLLVTDKKLYDYFQRWSASVHRQEGVGCVDCHGGDPKASEKDPAHGNGGGGSEPGSRVYYEKISSTCGNAQCHESILDGFVKSKHYASIASTEAAAAGPTCVTCHESMDTSILDVNSVQASCARCHNEATQNRPDIPERARDILNRFLSANRFYRYISKRAGPAEASQFFGEMDDRIEALSVLWHSFDLSNVDAETGKVLDQLKAKRKEIRDRFKVKRKEIRDRRAAE